MDLAVVVAGVGAAGAGLSAATAVWNSVRERTAFARGAESAFHRSRETASEEPSFDVFFSYSAADSKGFARELAEALQHQGVRVWLDEDQVRVGENIYAKLGEGLNASRYGLVILSPQFLDGDWAQQELKALLEREGEQKTYLLPVLHGVSHDEVFRYAPELAMKRALSSDVETVEEIAEDVAKIARP